jgi:3-oxoacyl-[acyl-carrier protein] reductase
MLKNKVALVTGGSRGIGAAIVRRLAQDGAAVAFTYATSKHKAEEVARAIEAGGGKALAIQADSADAQAVQAAVQQTVDRFGSIDILVNSAGVLSLGLLDDFSLDDFDKMVAVNIRSVFVATQAAARHMGEGGRIITIGSTNAERTPFAGGAPYSMTKSAVAGLTRGLARDLGPRGITVNNVQPGPIDTDMNPSDGPMAEMMHSWMALPRHGHGSEIAAMVAYLAGPEAGFVTGASLNIDGGFSA